MTISRRWFMKAGGAAMFCVPGRHADACGSGTIRVRKQFEFKNLDPADYYPDDEVITLAVFGSLIRKTTDGKRRNHLTVSVDQESDTRIRFSLLNSAKWSDGNQVKASDVKYSFERIADSKRKAGHHDSWEKLDRVD